MQIINLFTGEKKKIKLTITDTDGQAIDLTDSTLSFKMYQKTKTVTKVDVDFDKSEQISGIVYLTLEASDLVTSGCYDCQLKIIFPDNTEIDKSDIFQIYLRDSII